MFILFIYVFFIVTFPLAIAAYVMYGLASVTIKTAKDYYHANR